MNYRIEPNFFYFMTDHILKVPFLSKLFHSLKKTFLETIGVNSNFYYFSANCQLGYQYFYFSSYLTRMVAIKYFVKYNDTF